MQLASTSIDVPKGYIVVYVKESEMRRFVIPISFLNQPSFLELLSKAEEEFGTTEGKIPFMSSGISSALYHASDVLMVCSIFYCSIEDEVVRFKETSNEIQHVSKCVSDICLGDDEDFNPAGQSSDAAMRAKRLFFGSIVMKAFEDMMGSDSLVKGLEQDLHITIAAARIGVTFKKKGGEGSEQKLQILIEA
ncbi:hypothetical protein SO802_006968 [Lithocarpus litseifolius]|uniref:Uncharacterized protein n=1 Tax=Lithocarpus litseifolius TaxID=425828 RepID=A0AAW2DRK8_9ROSI